MGLPVLFNSPTLLGEILVATQSSTRPCLFIDGVDRIVDPSVRKVVNDLLRTLADLPLSHDGSRHWAIVVSTREENLQELHAWLDWRIMGQPELLQVPELSSEEVTLIAEHSPRLKPLLSLEQLGPILKNPFLLSLLEDRRILSDPDVLPPVATEIEVSEVWWENVIGGSGVGGRARQQALLQLGRRAMTSPGRRVLGNDIAAEVLTSLESDRVLLRDADRDVYRFSHDLLEDWVFYRVLNQHREELITYLRDIGQPFGLFRAMQLLGASLLEKNETGEAWMQLLWQVEQAIDLALRWRQALLTAPLLSVHARNLLHKAEPWLVAEDARRLSDLLVALRTVEVNPDFSLLPAVAMVRESLDDILPLLFSSPVPRWRVWFPLMGWLLERLDALPTAIGPETVKLMEMWQQKAPEGYVYRTEIGKIALAWLNQLGKWDTPWYDEVEDDDDPEPF